MDIKDRLKSAIDQAVAKDALETYSAEQARYRDMAARATGLNRVKLPALTREYGNMLYDVGTGNYGQGYAPIEAPTFDPNRAIMQAMAADVLKGKLKLPKTTEEKITEEKKTILSGGDTAPDGSGATGTQLSMRQPSPDEMLAFLGAGNRADGAQNLAMYGRTAGDLVPGMGIREADVPLSRLANEDDMEDMLYGGRTPEEINRLQRGEALDEVVIDSDYELSDAEKGQKSTEDIKKMVRERNAMRKAEKPKTEAAKPQERRTVNGKTDYMQPVIDAETMRRRAFLDEPDIMQGLKNREMQSGYMTVGGQTRAITPEFLKSGSAEDLGAELSMEERDQLKVAERASTAQTFLEDRMKNVIAPSATTQNPMLGAGEGFDATDGKTTKYMDVSTANFVENMATPAEMNKEFDPFDYDPESEQYAQNYFG